MTGATGRIGHAWSVAVALGAPTLLSCTVIAALGTVVAPRDVIDVIGISSTRQLVWPMIPWVLSVPTGSLVEMAGRPLEAMSRRGRLRVGCWHLGALVAATALLAAAAPDTWTPVVIRNSSLLVGLALLAGPATGPKAASLPGLLAMITMWVVGTEVQTAKPWAVLFHPSSSVVASRLAACVLLAGLLVTCWSLTRPAGRASAFE